MFSYCSSLIQLPDISKWNIINVKNMSEMFSYCSSLPKISNISLWNINYKANITKIFYHCSFLIMPHIFKWNIKINNNLFISSTSTNENSSDYSIFSFNNKLILTILQ